MTKLKTKLFVLDTNVILHDSGCLMQFEDNDLVIPVAVLEELDHFKKGSESIHYHAREFLRQLDKLSGEKLFDGGLLIGPGLGKVSLRLDRKLHEDLILNFSDNKPDHHVLNTAYYLRLEYPGRQVILITKDVNLRMKAKSINLLTQDYLTDQVKDIDTLYRGQRMVEDIDTDLIRRLYEPPFEFDATEMTPNIMLKSNEYMIMRSGQQSALASFDSFSNKIRHIEKVAAYGIMPRNAEQTFALDALMNPHIQLVTVTGKAGTGKTLLALAAALQKKQQYRQIFMARPVVPLSNKDLGFLPGDIQSKLDPYMQPLYDNLGVIKNQTGQNESGKAKITQLLDENKLVIAPLAYIRGRSLVSIYFIVDEAQNLTPHEVKTIITRAGEKTKIIFTGDIFQIDHPYLDARSNGLSYLIEKMQGQKLYAHINLEKGERSELSELASNLL
ncbi:PhoH family protein [bacterium]|nr:PhoH family protein [bacterium]